MDEEIEGRQKLREAVSASLLIILVVLPFGGGCGYSGYSRRGSGGGSASSDWS
jgi:hypothetical protein